MAGINLDAELDKFYPDPQQDDDVPVYMCAECKAPIREGEYYYYLDGTEYCEDCAQLFRYEAKRWE